MSFRSSVVRLTVLQSNVVALIRIISFMHWIVLKRTFMSGRPPLNIKMSRYLSVLAVSVLFSQAKQKVLDIFTTQVTRKQLPSESYMVKKMFCLF